MPENSPRLRPPRLTLDVVPRPHLVHQLNAGLARQLILISAPAGDQKAFGERSMKWLVTDYHMAADTIQKDWNWKGAQQLSVIGLLAGLRVANQDAMPAWLPASRFNQPRGTTAAPPPRQ